MFVYDKYKVSVPVGQSGDAAIEKFTVPEGPTLESILIQKSGRRPPSPGEYTALTIRGQIWMSDTVAEIIDHLTAIQTIRRTEAKSVLINGLGIGLVVQAAIQSPSVRVIDVVENHGGVINLVGNYYHDMAEKHGKTLNIRNGDALSIKWQAHECWNVVWHDIWQNVTADNLEQMKTLHRRYGRRCGWQGSWCRAECERQERHYKKQREYYR